MSININTAKLLSIMTSVKKALVKTMAAMSTLASACSGIRDVFN